MTKRLITLVAAGAVALGGFTFLQAKEHGHGPKFRHFKMGGSLEHLSEKLDLTADQKTRVQPIIDQTKPQIEAIHREAKEKMRALIESTAAQIRPLLTAPQQEKLDAIKTAHENMCKAMEEMHEAEKQ